LEPSGSPETIDFVLTVTSETLAGIALERLRSLTGEDCSRFRPGQLEAIRDVVVDRARVLCVQRTGWGKSALYFVATALLREAGAGPTLIVSPLLALMRNQIAAAQRLGLRAHTVNSTFAIDSRRTRSTCC
jgi:ATP-dependent DNA helicase RecQ